jgi:hypothetical protein
LKKKEEISNNPLSKLDLAYRTLICIKNAGQSDAIGFRQRAKFANPLTPIFYEIKFFKGIKYPGVDLYLQK